MSRAPALQSFLDALAAGFGQATDTAAVRVAEKIFTAGGRATLPGQIKPHRLPVCEYIEPAVSNARSADGDAARVANALAELESDLQWRRRVPSAADSDDFQHNHANAVVLGPDGLEVRNDIQIGISLLAPLTTYPDHRHPPEEIYFVLSAGEWRQNTLPWHEPGIGGVVHNEPDIVHAMRAADAPLLAVWCLWMG